MSKLVTIRLFAAVVLLSAVTSTIFAAGLASPAAASPAVVTLTQGGPTSASVADGAGYSGQLTVTNGTGTVSYTETASTDSGDVVVTFAGAINASTSLAPGTYNVWGTDGDTNGDTGTWGFALMIRPPGWSQGTLIDPPRGHPNSISCPTESFCVAVDEGGYVLTYNGSSWSQPVKIDPGNDLSSVSCPSARFCVAVDYDGNVFTYDGSSWSSPDDIDPGEGGLQSVSCPVASSCVAVDYGGNVLTYDGSSWSSPDDIDPTAGNPLSVSCPTVSFCVAVDYGGNVLIYNGSSWTSPDNIDVNKDLSSVSCPSANFCAAVDGEGNVFTYDGSTWSSPDEINAGNMTSVSCPTASFCVAVDTAGNVFSYNGTSWSSPESLGAGRFPDSISCASSGFCALVDGDGNLLTYNGSSWSSPDDIDPTASPLESISCPSASFCAAVDDWGNVLTYDGSSWSSPDDIALGNILSAVSCPSASFCAAVGMGYAVTYNGSSWASPNPIDAGDAMSSVSCPTASFCAAVDLTGDVLTYTGSSWSSPVSIDAGKTLGSVSCPSASFCAAVDWRGNAFTYNGSSWSSPERIDAGSVQLSSVSCPTTSFCVAVDEYGNALTYNGSSWSSPRSIDPSNGGLSSVSCPTTYFCAAVDWSGNVLSYNGNSWSLPESLGAISVSCPNASFCAAVDEGADAYLYRAIVTLTQGSPTSANVVQGTGYSGQLTVTNGTGAVSYTETASTYSTDVVVTSTGAINAATLLAAGTYSVSGTDHDANGDSGTWSFVLTVIPAPPPPPPGVTSSQNCSSSSPSGTCSATNDATTVAASGEGSATVSQYSSAPVGAPSFSSAGEYFDVEIAAGSSFTSLTITDCNLNGGTGLEWWNGGAWVPVLPAPTYTAGPPACLSATLSSTSSPTLAQLTGTVFGVSASVPGAPTNVAATAGNASATLTWAAPVSNGGSAITGYAVTPYIGTAAQTTQTFASPATTETATDLSNGTAYTFTVAAINAVGTGPNSAVSNSVTPVKAASRTTITSVTSSPVVGKPVVIGVQVSGPTTTVGSLTPTGQVIVIDGARFCDAALSGLNGTAAGTCSITEYAVSSYSLTANYEGDADFSSSSTATSTALSVGKAASKTVLKLSTTKVPYGDEQIAHLSVTVSPQYSGITPSGSVTVKASTRTLCVIKLVSGTGLCKPLSAGELNAGAYSLVATYGGSTNFDTSSSSAVTFTVANATSKTSLKFSAAKVTYGDEQVLHLSVTVSPQYPGTAPAGKVTVKESTTALCVITLKSGKGSCRMSPKKLKAGTYRLVATYGASTNFKGSVSAKETLTVAK